MVDSRKFTVSDDVVAHLVGGEMVLLNLASGLYFGLNAVGSCVWDRLNESAACLDELVDRIEAEFDAPRDAIERDLVSLLSSLAERQLITSTSC